MVRRKERLGKGEKSIIQRKELHSEPCWCELYESEKWRTIKIWKYALWAKNMVFKSSDWRMIMPQFLPLAEKKNHGQVIWTSSSSEWHLEGNCVSSLLPRRVLTQIVPDCPSWDRQHYDGRSRGKPRLPVGLGLPWKQKKKAVLCLDTLRDSVHFSLQGYRSSPLSRLGLSSEGGWHSMSRLTLFLSNFPFFCLKEFLPNYCPATQGLNLLFPSLLLSQGAGQYLPHSDSTCFVLCSCAVACVEASHYFF